METDSSTATQRKQKRIAWWKKHKGHFKDDTTDTTAPAKKSKKVSETKTKLDQPEMDSNEGRKQRFILFIGNLPFDLAKDDILSHFRCIGGHIDIRLMTKKDTGISKGCGFLEVNDATSYTKALNLHHSTLGGRKINVEVTCGGGGSSEKRIGKLKVKRDKFKKKRGKKSKPKSGQDKSSNHDKP